MDVSTNEADEVKPIMTTEQKSVTIEQCITAIAFYIATDTTVNSGSEGPRCIKCTQWHTDCSQLMIEFVKGNGC